MDDVPDTYDVLRNRPEVSEIDPRDLRKGHRLIGNRESVDHLVSLATGELQGEPDHLAPETVDAILGRHLQLDFVAHDSLSRDGTRCALCSGMSMQPTGLTMLRIDLEYGQPVLVWDGA